jgi:PAS domain-containing protein
MNDPLGKISYAADEQLLVLDADLQVIAASPAYYKAFKVEPDQTIDRPVDELGNGQWSAPALMERLKKLAAAEGEFDDFKMQHDFPGLGRRTMSLSARRSLSKDNVTESILLAIDDITGQKNAAEELIRRTPSPDHITNRSRT